MTETSALPETPAAHTSVLLDETLDALCHERTSGRFVDATFGRGGHTRALLDRLDDTARVYAFDKDPEAIACGEQLMQEDPRLVMIHGSYAQMSDELLARNVHMVDGIMADLGVSSPQLDDASRGFSFMHAGPLDMRMNPAHGLSARDWLAKVDEQTLANVLFSYGEERYSRRIARAIKEAGDIETTTELAEIIRRAHPRWEKHKHPATRSFQAIRIAVNEELKDLELFLPQAVDLLNPLGRLAVISFHSLEDRIVKQFIQKESTVNCTDPYWGGALINTKRLKKIARIAPSDEEVKQNSRARSAWLRVAEKL